MKCEIVTGNMPQLWEDLLSQLHEKEYPSESIRHYREAMGRVDRYMRENQILEYTEAVGETYLATHGGRISSGRQFYMSFYVRRLNDILNKRPYVVVHTRKKQKDLKHFSGVFERFDEMLCVADGLFCREIDGLFCRSSPDIIVRRRCVLSHKRRGWLQPSPSFRYSRNLALQDELYHPVINNGPAVLVCVDKRLGTGPVNQSRDAG